MANWYDNIEVGAPVVLSKYNRVSGDSDYIYVLAQVMRLTKTMIICSFGASEEVKILKRTGEAGAASVWERGWKMLEFTEENKNRLKISRMQRSFRKMLAEVNKIKLGELDLVKLEKAVTKLEELTNLISNEVTEN